MSQKFLSFVVLFFLFFENVKAQENAIFLNNVEKVDALVTEIAYGLNEPFSVGFLPLGDYLVTERTGSMRIIDNRGRVGMPIKGVPDVATAGQGGLLDVVVDRNFKETRQIYFCYSQSKSSRRTSTAIAKGNLNEKLDKLENVTVIYSQLPRLRSALHYGCRIIQDDDRSLFLSFGDRAIASYQAQRNTNTIGTIIHIDENGKEHPNNPFNYYLGEKAEIWSWGHRNPQGLIKTPDGRLWAHEKGAYPKDVFNQIKKGTNYGWPLVDASKKIKNKNEKEQNFEKPVLTIQPSIEPSGLSFLTSNIYGENWKNSFFIGSLKKSQLIRIKLSKKNIILEKQIIKIGVGSGIRDVRQREDGFLYVLTNDSNGKLLRLEPNVEENSTLIQKVN